MKTYIIKGRERKMDTFKLADMRIVSVENDADWRVGVNVSKSYGKNNDSDDNMMMTNNDSVDNKNSNSDNNNNNSYFPPQNGGFRYELR